MSNAIPMTEYQALTAAGRTLAAIVAEISKEDGTYTSPAWRMVLHAEQHVSKWAESELRAPLTRCYKQSEEECDLEEHKCVNCGKTMCFSHSNRHETEGLFCDGCAMVSR